MDHEKFLLEAEIKAIDHKYLLSYKDQYFYIGELLYYILLLRQQQKEWEEIRTFILHTCSVDLSVVALQQQFDEKVGQMIAKATLVEDSYLHTKITILSVKAVNILARPFSYLFRRYFFEVFFGISIFSTLLYFLLHDSSIGYASLSAINFKHFGYSFVLMYLFSILVMIFHEVGHAAASYRFKVPPGRIGFGLYLIFPVFFTDVSKIWTLDRKKRIVVNLGGIYFQLLVNLLLIVFLEISKGLPKIFYSGIEMTIILNTVIMISCLNPFLRNDGYWVYSDLFSIPNLMEKAFLAPAELFRSRRTLLQGRLSSKKNLPVLIYGILNYVIIVVIMISIGHVLQQNYIKLSAILSGNRSVYASFMDTNTLIDFIKISFSLFIIGIYCYKTINHLGRSFFKNQALHPIKPIENLLKF